MSDYNSKVVPFVPLPKTFYLRDDILDILKDSIGKIILHKENNIITAGRIVEAEAYIGKFDKASHAYRFGKTKRTDAMFREGGIAYIFNVHKYNQFCFVTNEEEVANAILVRAIEPIVGIEVMMSRRGFPKNIVNLGNGPGILCQSLNITKVLYGIDLTSYQSELILCDDGFEVRDDMIVKTKRIGIDYAEEYRNVNWRYYLKDNKFVSRK